MKKLIRVVLILAFGLVAVAGVAVAALAIRRPAQRPPSAERIERTPERLARGTYLVEHVTDCLGCTRCPRESSTSRSTSSSSSSPSRSTAPCPRPTRRRTASDTGATYLGRATKAEFIGRFKSFVSLTGDNAPPAPKGRNTVMPWLPLSGMTEDDLGMLYDFFKTLEPIEHKVNPFPDAEPGQAPLAPKAAGG